MAHEVCGVTVRRHNKTEMRICFRAAVLWHRPVNSDSDDRDVCTIMRPSLILVLLAQLPNKDRQYDETKENRKQRPVLLFTLKPSINPLDATTAELL